jgi:hypothetical protein
MRWACHVAFVGGRRNVYEVLVEKLNEGDQFDSLAIDGWIVLKWILK